MSSWCFHFEVRKVIRKRQKWWLKETWHESTDSISFYSSIHLFFNARSFSHEKDWRERITGVNERKEENGSSCLSSHWWRIRKEWEETLVLNRLTVWYHCFVGITFTCFSWFFISMINAIIVILIPPPSWSWGRRWKTYNPSFSWKDYFRHLFLKTIIMT